MLDKPLTGNQAIALLMMFQFGSSAVIGLSSNVAQDSWISMLLAAMFMAPILLMYARLIRLNPKVGLYTALEYNFGRVVGRIASALMTWFALHLCALVMRNFSEFIQISALRETPQLPVAIIMLIAVGYLAHCGVKALGKWAVVVTPVVLGILAITVILSLNLYEYENILPVAEHSLGTIARDAYQVFSFPFAETVLFLCVADKLDTRANPTGVYLKGVLAAATVLLIASLRNVFVLGSSVLKVSYFPSFMAARIITLGDFLARIEGSISINFMLAGITKITLCLIAASRGIAHVFGVDDWKHMIMPTGALALMLSVIVYDNTMQMYSFIRYYPFYAIPFQILLPGALWIASEIRARRKKPARRAVEPA